jgi:plasmid segregation protein ParM
MKIGIDIGYSSVKGISENGMRVHFLSVVAPAGENLLNGAIKNILKHTVKTGTGEYRVGEAALQSSSAVSTLSREKPAEIHDLLASTAAYLLSAGEGDTLVVGLPISYYRTQRQELQKRLMMLNEFMSVDSGPIRRISFSDVKVFPQALGALFLQELEDGLIGIIDIGHLTTDYLLFDIQQGQPIPIFEACGSIEIGVSQVHQRLAAAFHVKTGLNLPFFMQNKAVEKSLRGESLTVAGKNVDLSREIKQICRETSIQIEEAVKSHWRDRIDFVQRIVGIGGGMELLRQYFTLRQLEIQPDPVFANAQGFLTLAGARD